MGILKVSCPGCAAVLKSKNPDGWAAGTRMTCPKCQSPIVAGESPAAKPAKAAVSDDTPRPRKRPRPVEDDEDDEEDDRPRKKGGNKGKAKPAGMSPAVYWSIRGAVLLVLLIGLGVAVMFFLDRQKENEATRKENDRIREKNAQIEAEGNR